MAKTKGPLFSLDASGTVAGLITFSQWKGRSYVRQHVIPLNPQSTKQVNVRTAMTLLVAEWQGEEQAYKDEWDAFAKQFNKSGWNMYASRGMKEYMVQHGSDVTPTGVSVTGTPPAEVWVWVIV
ncbi:hypothetical protein ES703_55694 [subsurface metagenome]